MIAIFVSQCEKKAINRTSRVLDSFANRIGDRTWKTIITEEGLLAVKKLLKMSASKSTSVSCHIIHSNKDIKLAWVVGKRAKFNFIGEVPVSLTTREIINTHFENSWPYLPLIKNLTALAALFHDFGKSTVAFQEKLLKSAKTRDEYRHEFISCLFLAAMDEDSGHDFRNFLNRIVLDEINYEEIALKIPGFVIKKNPFEKTSDFVFYIIWLVLAHHKLPMDDEPDYWIGNDYRNLASLKTIVKASWGYYSKSEESSQYSFDLGLPSDSVNWKKNLQKWASRSLDDFQLFQKAEEDDCYRLILQYSRLALIFGDHLYSSKERNPSWKTNLKLFANTDKSRNLNQFLDEHLVGVSKEALNIVVKIPRLSLSDEKVVNNHLLSRYVNPQSPFSWQNTAIRGIINWKSKNIISSSDSVFGFFGVCISSTGTGKTFANAKIMQALSNDSSSLRYSLGLGLRTLTLQTGDEYRNRIGLDDTELGVIIGSKAVQTLHQLNEESNYTEGSDSSQELFTGFVDYSSSVDDEFLSFLFKNNESKKLLMSPVLACTIDYLMLATETMRGGRWILPFFRILSSDLVIDEIDDFFGSDLIAIGRLIHLAGLLGRKVLISSATIPPDMAEGYFRLYLDGFSQYKKFHNEKSVKLGCGWFDEFSTVVKSVATFEDFRNLHVNFCNKRIENILKKESILGVRRKATIINCDDVFDYNGHEERREAYYSIITEKIPNLHATNCILDPETHKKVSFGCIRVAHINRCVELSKFLLEKANDSSMELKIMAYHSRQLLLLRSIQERHLDEVLPCKGGTREKALSNSIIRNHINESSKNDIIFLVVCTPVEEIGRDHDFDWAIVEPSSFRSIIQLAGRVRRHREEGITKVNIGLMQYNLRALDPENTGAVFCRPGYESKQNPLNTRDLYKLLDYEQINKSVNSIPRLCVPNNLDFSSSLIGLEHFVTKSLLNDMTVKGPSSTNGWMNNSVWSITGLPQFLAPFRKELQKTKTIIDSYDGDDRIFVIEDGCAIFPIEKLFKIERFVLDEKQEKHLWLKRDYTDEVHWLSEELDLSIKKCSLKFGEIEIPEGEGFRYSDYFGMEKI